MLERLVMLVSFQLFKNKKQKPLYRHPACKAAHIIFSAPSQTPSCTSFHKIVLTLPEQHQPVNAAKYAAKHKQWKPSIYKAEVMVA